MSKKTIRNLMLLGIILILAVVVYVYKGGRKYSSDRLMSGVITEIKGESIVVKGLVSTSDQHHKEVKTWEFSLNDQTVYNKTELKRPAGIEPGQVFTPEKQTGPGSRSDLKVDMQTGLLISDENLFVKDRAIIKEINYEIFN